MLFARSCEVFLTFKQFPRHFLCVTSSVCGLRTSLFSSESACFVPNHNPVSVKDVNQLQRFLDFNHNLLIITGAGISTESGIPDYRSENVGIYSRSGNRPVQYKDFVASHTARKRYWARNYVGWPRFSSLEPNISHLCLTKWEKNHKLYWLVTQNVDRLHHKAGTERVIELHGTTFRVKCLRCSYSFSRFSFQDSLKQLNKKLDLTAVAIRPDGDVEINQDIVEEFEVPDCNRCGGILKPDVVFFGETVPMSTVERIYEKVRQSSAVLVLGSSLEVYSAYRFLLAAREQNKPIAIVNIGKTRGDSLASLKLENRCSDILPKIKI